MNKPRIRLRAGIWVCSLMTRGLAANKPPYYISLDAIGCGLTPAMAYRNWQQNKGA